MATAFRSRLSGGIGYLYALAMTTVVAAEPPRIIGTTAPLPANRLCGPNSVYVLLRLHGIPVAHDQITKYWPTHEEGMSLLEMKQACKDLGLETEVRQYAKEDLRGLRFPVVAHVNYGPERDADHYCVITRRLDQDRIEAIDGTTGHVHQFYIEKMGNIWRGHLLVPRQRRHSENPAAGVIVMVLPWVALGGYVFLTRGNPKISSPRPTIVRGLDHE